MNKQLNDAIGAHKGEYITVTAKLQELAERRAAIDAEIETATHRRIELKAILAALERAKDMQLDPASNGDGKPPAKG